MSEFLLDNSMVIILVISIVFYSFVFYLTYFARLKTGDNAIENLFLVKVMLRNSGRHSIVGSTTKISQDLFKVVSNEDGYERVEK